MVTFDPATARTLRRVEDALWDCQQTLSTDASIERRQLQRRLKVYTVTDLENFAGTVFTHEDERADLRRAQIPDVRLNQDPWRQEYWREYSNISTDYYFYDMGFKNLENDSAAVNLFVSRKFDQYRHASFQFTASPRRAKMLEILHRFRWAFHARVLDEYRRRGTPRDYFSEYDLERMAMANQNSNVDVFGVTDRKVPLTAANSTIVKSLRMTLQISYDQPADYLRPSLDGLLRARGEPPSVTRSLPFMFRLRAEKRDEVVESFWRSFGHLRVCEIARYTKARGTPDEVEARMLLEALRRLVSRGCQVVVAAQSKGVFQLFEDFGFIRDRFLPTHSPKPEHLVVLHVNSPEFWLTYGRVRAAAGFR